MKKYLFFILSLFFLPITALCVGPSFEIYSGGGTSWPTVYNITVSPVRNGNVTIGANAFDISGIYSMVAIIKNVSSVEVAREVMYDDGAHEDDNSADGRYAAMTDVSSYPVGTYYVYILATDNLGNSAIYAAEDRINLSAKQTAITGVIINPEMVSVGGNISFSATLKYYDGTNLGTVEQIDFYLDQISSSNFIGSAYTNASNGTTDIYTHSLDASVGPGEHVLIANYTGDFKNASSYGQQQFVVFRDEAATLTEINPFIIGPPSIGAGQTAVLYATLIFSENKHVIPDKDILFVDNTEGEVIGTATTDPSGVANIHYTLAPTASLGSHIISAIHYADADTGSSYNSAALNVLEGTKIDPFVALPSTAGAGASVTLSATLKTLGGDPLIGQRIFFTNNATGDNIGSAFTNASGVATVPLTAPATIGDHAYLATYNGDLTKSGSVAMAHLTVMQGTYMENVSVSPGTASAGDTVTFSALLKYSNGTVAANKAVNFYLDSVSSGNLLKTKNTDSNGIASINYTILSSTAAGSHNIIASYAGTSSVLGCTGTAPLNIIGRQTEMTLTATPTSLRPGQNISLTAYLKYAGSNIVVALAPISFSEVTSTPVDLGSRSTNGSGYAGLSYTIPPNATEGTHTIKATYAGSGSILPTQATVNFTVTRTGTRISNYTPAAGTAVTAGSNVIVSATLVNDSGTALYSKPIVFTDTRTNTVLGTVNTSGSGYASVTYSVPPNAAVGTHNISMSFAGDSNYSGCSASTSINVKNTQLTFSISPTSATVNSNVTLTATLKTASGSFISGKTITFTDTTSGLSTTQTTVNGVASKVYTIPSSSAIGTHNWTASFAGDSTYSAISASTTLNVRSLLPCEILNLTISPSGSSGTTSTGYRFSAKLQDGTTGTPLSNRQIQFVGTSGSSAGGTSFTIATVPTNTSGIASTSSNYYFTNAGAYGIRARFVGDSQYDFCQTSSTTLNITAPTPQPYFSSFTTNPNSFATTSQIVTITAILIDNASHNPLANQSVNFVVTDNSDGSQINSFWRTTDSNGIAQTTVRFSWPGVFTITATYAGSYGSASASAGLYVSESRLRTY